MIISKEEVFRILDNFNLEKKKLALFPTGNNKVNLFEFLILKYVPAKFILSSYYFYNKHFKKKIKYDFSKSRFTSVSEKLLAVEFIKYIISKNISFDTSLYYEEEKEIKKYIYSIIYLAFNDFLDQKIYKEIIDFSFREKFLYWYKTIKRSKDYVFLKENLYFYPYEPSLESFYFYHGLKELPKKVIKRIEGGTFVDCGVCKGDSVIVFQQYKPKMIIGFEPDEKNYADAKKIIEKNKFSNVQLIKKGVGEKKKIVFFKGGLGGSSAVLEEGNQKIEITTIDSLNEKIDLIKKDIEGYEYNSIFRSRENNKKV